MLGGQPCQRTVDNVFVISVHRIDHTATEPLRKIKILNNREYVLDCAVCKPLPGKPLVPRLLLLGQQPT